MLQQASALFFPSLSCPLTDERKTSDIISTTLCTAILKETVMLFILFSQKRIMTLYLIFLWMSSMLHQLTTETYTVICTLL